MFFFVWDVAYYSLKTSIELFFFPFSFANFRFVSPQVVAIFSSGCNHAFVCCLQFVVLMLQHCLQCWQVPHLLLLLLFLFLLLFLLLLLLVTFNLSTSSLGCKALCMVISFLVLWYICLSSSQVHFKNGPDYLTRRTAQVFISLIRFLR